jgi:hypothetical protein
MEMARGLIDSRQESLLQFSLALREFSPAVEMYRQVCWTLLAAHVWCDCVESRRALVPAHSLPATSWGIRPLHAGPGTRL